MKTYIKIIIGLFIVIVVLLMYGKYTTNKLEDQIVEWQNKAAALDTNTYISETTIQRLTQQLDKVSTKNEAIAAELKKRKGEIITKNEIIASYRDSLHNISTVDTIIISDTGDTTRIASFDTSGTSFNIRGYFEKQPPWKIYIQQIQFMATLEIDLVEYKDGHFETFIDTNTPKLQITNLKTTVKRYHPSFKDQISLIAGIGWGKVDKQNNFNIDLGLSFKSSQLIFSGQTYGKNNVMIRYQRLFDIFK